MKFYLKFHQIVATIFNKYIIFELYDCNPVEEYELIQINLIPIILIISDNL